MANPLHVFRKYQYVFLVAFGVMLMFAFVVAPPLSDYLQTRAERSQGGNPVVVTWTGGELKDLDLANLRTRHLQTTRFLRTLENRVEATEAVSVKRNDEQVSLIKGMTYSYVGEGTDPEHVQIVVGGEVVEAPVKALQMIRPKVPRVGQASNEEELVQRLMLAEKARALGVVISDAAIEDYLDNLCDASESNRPDYRTLLQTVTNGRLDYKQFIAQMAIELAAQRMLMMSERGLVAASPELLYECYNRLNRHVTAELLAVDVATFVSEVPEPTDADIVALYEKGKDEFPVPLLPDPGFKQREKIAFGYFQGTFDEFLQREMDLIRPTITNERIEKYYEDNKATEFKMPELPADKPAADQPAPDAAVPGSTPAPSGEATPPSTTEPAAPPTTEPAAPATTEPAAPPATEPAAPPPTEPAAPPTTEPAAPPTTEPAAPPTTEPAAPPAPAEEPGKEGEPGRVAIQLVSYQSQDPPAPTQDEPAKEAIPPVPATPDQPQGPTDVPAPDPAKTEPAPSVAPAAPEALPAAGAPAVQAQPGAEPATGSAAAPSTPESPPAGDTPAAGAQKPVQYKPLDDTLREEIRTNLARLDARAPAQEKLEKAVDQVRSAVDRYARQLSRSELLKGSAPLTPLDFATLAKENNLTHQKTPLLDKQDVYDIQQADPAEGDQPYYEFVRARETVFQRSGMVYRTLADVGYGEVVALFLPRRLVAGYVAPEQQFAIPPDKLFLYWREQVVPERVPPLEEIRDEVVKAWKLQQALPLARARAERMAKQAAEAARPLAEVFADNAANVITTRPFTWMTRGSLPGSMQQAPPRLSEVTGTTTGGQGVAISGAGQDFMRAVSDLEVGQVGVAVNQPQKFVYVARVVQVDPTEDQRREAFFAAGITPEVRDVLQMDQTDIIVDWFDDLKTEFGIDWKRKPERNWQYE